MILKFSIVFIGLMAMTSCLNISSQNYETKVDITFDKSIDNKGLKVMINPYGYLLDGHELKKYIGKTSNYTVLFKEGSMQSYKKENINTFSDYYIYAKYNNQYAKMKYTNGLVMGDNKTDIKIFINMSENIAYLSSSENSSSVETIHQNAFKDKEKFSQDDMNMLKNLDDLN
ncbi:hypothetical protein GJV03_09060 [Acinetobacter sp. RIT698]|jgi:phage anti-repressor protein|uniref:hypothetical protein n=1 Tax=Acinetobacter sp. RIT698 TaxID=2666192 RepID=UPI0012ACCAE7|nr:hypothetical protein [Acinetobacter sp. RIT698]MRT37308.1 hypothetical protein [Acinetobacter sp. RIT698]